MSRIAPPVLEYAQARVAGAMCRPVGVLAVLWGLLRLMLGIAQISRLWPDRAILSGNPFVFASIGAVAIGGIALLAAGLLLIVRHRAARMLLLAFGGLSVVPMALGGVLIVQRLAVLGGSEPISPLLQYAVAILIDHALPGVLALLAARSQRLWEDTASNPAHALLWALGLIWGATLIAAYGWRLYEMVSDYFDREIRLLPDDLVACGVCGVAAALPLSVVLLAGSLSLGRWRHAPRLLSLWAIVWLAVQVVHAAFLFGWVIPLMPSTSRWIIVERSWLSSISIIGYGAIGVFLNLALPVLVLVYCRRGAAPVEDRAC